MSESSLTMCPAHTHSLTQKRTHLGGWYRVRRASRVRRYPLFRPAESACSAPLWDGERGHTLKRSRRARVCPRPSDGRATELAAKKLAAVAGNLHVLWNLPWFSTLPARTNAHAGCVFAAPGCRPPPARRLVRAADSKLFFDLDRLGFGTTFGGNAFGVDGLVHSNLDHGAAWCTRQRGRQLRCPERPRYVRKEFVHGQTAQNAHVGKPVHSKGLQHRKMLGLAQLMGSQPSSHRIGCL